VDGSERGGGVLHNLFRVDSPDTPFVVNFFMKEASTFPHKFTKNITHGFTRSRLSRADNKITENFLPPYFINNFFSKNHLNTTFYSTYYPKIQYEQ
jgi:hypothetical protein